METPIHNPDYPDQTATPHVDIEDTPHPQTIDPAPSEQSTADTRTEETPPEEQLEREWTRISQMNTTNVSHAEEQWTDLLGKTTDAANDHLRKFLQSEIRLKQLKNQMDTLRDMAKAVTETDTTQDPTTEGTTVKAIGDVTKEEFKIDRGTNTSARVTNTFDEARIQKILEAVEIGPDLTGEQRE